MVQFLNVLIKPASGNCNMNCSYCFYGDVIDNRDIRSYGYMSIETLEDIVKKSLQYAKQECTIAFQGGEPTLRGLDFYKDLVLLQNKHNENGIVVNNAIQTNGLLIDDKWASYFAENNFLVGLSVDGNKAVHDNLRKDKVGDGTYDRILHAAALLDKYHVEYNILTVVTTQIARRAYKIYQNYKKHKWSYMQFIPCLDPLREAWGSMPYSLSPENYAEFLKTLFDLWYNDVSQGVFVYIRYFENLVAILCGRQPESCDMGGKCSLQYVIEADGSVYPCDFYVLDKYRIGNLNEDSFEEIDNKRKEIRFIEQSKPEEECEACQWFGLCRGGCRRNREMPGGIGLNRYCAAYKEFFPYSFNRLLKLARR